jgi:hypothetical protein
MADTEHVIEVLTENVAGEHLDHLRAMKVSYIFGGKISLDLALILEKLRNLSLASIVSGSMAGVWQRLSSARSSCLTILGSDGKWHCRWARHRDHCTACGPGAPKTYEHRGRSYARRVR